MTTSLGCLTVSVEPSSACVRFNVRKLPLTLFVHIRRINSLIGDASVGRISRCGSITCKNTCSLLVPALLEREWQAWSIWPRQFVGLNRVLCLPGHGENGTACAVFAKDRIPDNLAKSKMFRGDVVQAFHSSFVQTNAQMHRSALDDSMSGTTGKRL